MQKDAWQGLSTRAREGMRGDWVKEGESGGEKAPLSGGERERLESEPANGKQSSVHGMSQEKNT